MLTAIEKWRRSMSGAGDRKRILWDTMQKALSAFRSAAAELALYREPPPVDRSPPDETEPEHAQ